MTIALHAKHTSAVRENWCQQMSVKLSFILICRFKQTVCGSGRTSRAESFLPERCEHTFFPNDANTSFDLPTADPPMILVVEGNAQISESSTSNTTSTTTAVTPIAAVPATRPGNAAGPSTPAYRRPPMTCTVKIVKADFRRLRNGRVDFTPGAPTQPALPLELHRHLTDLYKCNICRELPITLPVICSMCCCQILGCRACVDSNIDLDPYPLDFMILQGNIILIAFVG